MTSVQEALGLILDYKKDFGTEEVELLRAGGRVLAQPVLADRDFPPFDRVTMDGIAISLHAFNKGVRSFAIETIQAAGAPQTTLINESNCIEIMTGAVLPAQTDVIVPYEQCTIKNGIATVEALAIEPQQYVHLQGADCKAGDVLIEKWQKITPAITGVLASVGMSAVSVLRHPKIAACSTGDELVEVTALPLAHQVRRSNSYALAAALLDEGISASLHHFKDDLAEMNGQLESLLQNFDVILLSGAVSKGKYDYLPVVLAQLGMKQVFHIVEQRPGKPFLFGTFENGPLVFGFPGNPVSTFVCYHQFFKPWLCASMRNQKPPLSALLTEDVTFKPPLTYHLLVQLTYISGSILATPVYSTTSGDMVALSKANGILKLPSERDNFTKGEAFELTLI